MKSDKLSQDSNQIKKAYLAKFTQLINKAERYHFIFLCIGKHFCGGNEFGNGKRVKILMRTKQM